LLILRVDKWEELSIKPMTGVVCIADTKSLSTGKQRSWISPYTTESVSSEKEREQNIIQQQETSPSALFQIEYIYSITSITAQEGLNVWCEI
jgi:hypothetical protein